ncbi:MAG: TonB-dependent receptor [Opitutaceae bacterium]|nr:TonB-dependent receptor [Opitutaceae bacterium]
MLLRSFAVFSAATFAGLVFAQMGARSPEEEVVEMDAIHVSTTLGNYAETTAATGSKISMEVMNMPSTLQMLNASFLEDRNAESLEDVYNYVLGLARMSGGATDFTLRGFSSQGAGLNLHNMQTDGLPGLTTRFGSPNTANIERVEVLKGPSSLLYGLVTPGGIINLVTKRPQEAFHGKVSASIATYAGFISSFGDETSYKGTVDVTGPIDRNKHWLYRMIFRVDDLGSFRRNNYEKNQYYYPSLTYVWDKNTRLNLQVEVLRQKRLADYIGIPVPFNNLAYLPSYDSSYSNPDDNERDLGEALTVTFDHRFANDWMLRIGGRSSNNRNSRRQLDFASLKSVLPVQNSTLTRRYRRFEGNNNRVNFLDINAYGDVGPQGFKNTLLVGMSYGIDLVGLTRLAHGPNVAAIPLYQIPAAVPYPADGTGQSKTRTEYGMYSVYASDHIKIGEKLMPSFGFRYDYQDGKTANLLSATNLSKTTSAAVPNAGVLYRFTSELSSYVSYSSSFFPNSLTSYDADNNQGFDPQTATQWEIGTKVTGLNGKLNATLSAYAIRMKNVLEATGNYNAQGNPISRLDGEQESRGIELETTWLVLPNWQVKAGISYLDAKVSQSNNPTLVDTRLTSVPRTTADFWTRYNVAEGALKGFGIGLGVTYQGPYPTEITGLSLPGRTLVDVALYYQWRRYKMALNVANALDAKYIANLSQDLKGVWPGNPRTITLSIEAPF